MSAKTREVHARLCAITLAAAVLLGVTSAAAAARNQSQKSIYDVFDVLTSGRAPDAAAVEQTMGIKLNRVSTDPSLETFVAGAPTSFRDARVLDVQLHMTRSDSNPARFVNLLIWFDKQPCVPKAEIRSRYTPDSVPEFPIDFSDPIISEMKSLSWGGYILFSYPTFSSPDCLERIYIRADRVGSEQKL
jgi:hypothetical protein